MDSKSPTTDVPGRLKARDLARECATLTRESYITTRPHPLLIQRESKSKKAQSKSGGFVTLATRGPLPASSGPREESWVYEVAKREGANAFSFLITLGRTRNNDVVIEEPCVSKFHASFKKDGFGRWTVTDMSSNGIKLDGVKIAREQTTLLPTGSVLVLAEEVELVFLLPPEAFEHLKRIGG